MSVEAMDVSTREGSGKGVARKLRAAGQVPAILYGEGGESQSIKLDATMFERVMRTGAHHRLLDLSVDQKTVTKALVPFQSISHTFLAS